MLRLKPLEACLHPFFSELRQPDVTLPNHRPLPPLFNFTQEGRVSDFQTSLFLHNILMERMILPLIVFQISVTACVS